MTEIDDKFKEEMVKPADEVGKFENHGITDDYLIGKLKEELEAEEEFQRQISKKEIVIIKKPLWKIRQDARKDAHKLKGDYPAEKHEHTGDVIFHSNVPEPDMPKEEEKFKDHPEQVEPSIGEHEVETEILGELIEEETQPTKDHHRSRRKDGK